jgi:hypothetical protein
MMAAAMFSFVGCKKVEEINNNELPPAKTGTPPGGGEASSSMRTFASFDLFSAEVEKTVAFTLAELVAYEQSINFNSYGKVADQRMEEILRIVDEYAMMEDTILAQTRLAQDIERLVVSSTYLQMVTDKEGEISCETKYFRSPWRYVMNLDRMFKADTLYFKVFESGYASCGSANYTALRNMSEAQFDLLKEDDAIFDIVKYDDGGRGNYGWSVSKTQTSGSNRVTVQLYFSKTFWQKDNYYYNTRIVGSYRAKIWSEKKFYGNGV